MLVSFMWISHSPPLQNIYHRNHIHKVSTGMDFSCCLSSTFLGNPLLHWPHRNTLAPVCLCSCTTKWLCLLRDLSQCWQLKGLSPVWVLECLSSWLLARHFRPQKPEPWTTFLWYLQLEIETQVAFHTGQMHISLAPGLLPAAARLWTVFSWDLRYLGSWNFWHSERKWKVC